MRFHLFSSNVHDSSLFDKLERVLGPIIVTAFSNNGSEINIGYRQMPYCLPSFSVIGLDITPCLFISFYLCPSTKILAFNLEPPQISDTSSKKTQIAQAIKMEICVKAMMCV